MGKTGSFALFQQNHDRLVLVETEARQNVQTSQISKGYYSSGT
jgi:hypothetical protein